MKVIFCYYTLMETTEVDGTVYDVDKIKLYAVDLPVEPVAIDQLKDQLGPGHTYWLDRDGNKLGPHDLLVDWHAAQQRPVWRDHVESVKRADLTNPIFIMKKTGIVFDGMHRLTKAYLQNEETILAKLFEALPGDAVVPQHSYPNNFLMRSAILIVMACSKIRGSTSRMWAIWFKR